MYIYYEDKIPQNLLRKECAFIYVKSGYGKLSINGIGYTINQGDFIRLVGRASISIENDLKYMAFTFDEIYFEKHIDLLERNSINLDKKIIFEIRFSNFTAYSTEEKERSFFEEVEAIAGKDDMKISVLMNILINLYIRVSYENLLPRKEEKIKKGKSSRKKEVIEKGVYLLEFTDKTIEEILREVKVVSPSYFTRVIKEATGRTPSKYRRSLKAKLISK